MFVYLRFFHPSTSSRSSNIEFITMLSIIYKIAILLLISSSCYTFSINANKPHKASNQLFKPGGIFRSSHTIILNEQKSKDSLSSDTSPTSTPIGDTRSKSQNMHYPTSGGMYDISEGPGHHLINVDHDKLDNLEERQSVNVHEVELDAATVTLVSFGTLALILFVLAFTEEGGLFSLVERFRT